jgi:hypothetical protein
MAFLAKHKLAAALVAGGVGYYLWRRRGGGRPPCGPGYTFKEVDPAAYALWSKDVRDYIARYGGLCMKAGDVTPLFDPLTPSDLPVAFDDNGIPLITRPSQL